MTINATTLLYNNEIITNGLISQTGPQQITDITYDGYNRPVIRGTSSAIGEPIYLDYFANQAVMTGNVGSSTVDSDGSWSIQFPHGLPSGIYDAYAGQGIHVGFPTLFMNFQTVSNTVDFIITSQLAPMITSVMGNATDPASQIASGTETDVMLPVIKGTAEPGSIVYIYDNGIKIGEAYTGDAAYDPSKLPSWDWSFRPSQPLSAGETHVFSVASRNLNLSSISMETTHSDYDYTIGVGVTPAQPAPLAPVITSVVDDAGANQGAVTDGGQTNDVRPTLHGTSEPGTVVTVSDNGHVIGTATTGADWQWSFTPNADLTAGTNTLSVSAARADGSGGSTAAWYTHVLDVTPSLDAVLANAGLSATAAPQATAAPTAQAAYVSEAAQATALPQHDLAY